MNKVSYNDVPIYRDFLQVTEQGGTTSLVESAKLKVQSCTRIDRPWKDSIFLG